jgi:hypothetical protein
MGANPFRIHGVVKKPYFADREDEVARIAALLQEPAAKLLVYGERRMGKTSAITVAVDQVQKLGGSALIADLSTASTVADMTNRVLGAAGQALGKRWSDMATDLIRSVGLTLSVSSDPVTGIVTPSLDIGYRQSPLADQQQALSRVLDTLNLMAKRRKRVLGVVLDEFQEIHRFGGEQAEWHLRGVIQDHDNISYVLAGSRPRLIRRMLGKGRAFYRFLDKMEFGPIDGCYLATWIDGRMADAGVECEGVGAECVRVGGPRTRDVMQIARKTFDLAVAAGRADVEVVHRAFQEVVNEEDGSIRSWWDGLTPAQQNIIRAVASAATGMTSIETKRQFALPTSGAVTQALGKFLESGDVVKGGPSGYLLDSPVVRGWVLVNAMLDLGVHIPIHWRPDDPYIDSAH